MLDIVCKAATDAVWRTRSNCWTIGRLSRSLMVDFILLSLFTLFYFSFLSSFIFLFLERLGLGFISHAVTSVTN